MRQQPQLPFPQEMLLPIVGGICVFALVMIVLTILYLLTLQKALSRVAPRNRLMEPAMVWLMLVPCFNLVWQFLVAIRVPDSLRNEFKDRERDDGSDYGKSIALTRCIIDIAGAVVSNIFTNIPDMQMIGYGISGVVTLIGLTLFFIFWVRIAGYSRMLAEYEGYRDRRFDRFDDDDDGYGGGKRHGDDDAPPDSYKASDPGRFQ
jgi:hypothetical protein